MAGLSLRGFMPWEEEEEQGEDQDEEELNGESGQEPACSGIIDSP